MQEKQDNRRDVLTRVTASLAAAISIIERAEELKKPPSKAVASDTMFNIMLADCKKALEAARKHFKQQ